MYKASEFTNDFYKLNDVADLLGVTVQTLHNYEKRGEILFQRTDGGHRFLERDELLRYLDSKGLLENDAKRDVIYVGSISFANLGCDDDDADITAIMDAYESEIYHPVMFKGSDVVKLINMIKNDKVRRLYTRYRKMLSSSLVNCCNKHSVDIKACDDVSDRTAVLAKSFEQSDLHVDDNIDNDACFDRVGGFDDVKQTADKSVSANDSVDKLLKTEMIQDYDLDIDRYSAGGIALIADFLYHCVWHSWLQQPYKNPAVGFSNDAKAGFYNEMPDEEYEVAVNAVRMKSKIWRDKESQTMWELMENAFRYCSKRQALDIIEGLVSHMVKTNSWRVNLGEFDKDVFYKRPSCLKKS